MRLMNVHLAARSLCAKILATLMESAQASRRTSPPAQEEIATKLPESEEPSEFEDFLSDLGSLPNEPMQAGDSVLKDATIAELTARLQDLQVLGDQLAATEQDRLRAVARVSELEAVAANEKPESARTEALEKQVASLSRARDRQTERLDRMRAKYEERKRVAADRWRELLELKRELRALKRTQ